MMMDQEQPVYIAVIPPDTSDASTTNFFPQHRSQPEFEYQSPSPNTSPGLSSEGYPPSPDTPSDGFQQDLAYAIQASSPSLDTLGLWDGGLSTSPSSLSPAFGFLNLTESSHQTGSDYGHTFGTDDMSLKVDPTQQTRASLSPLTIPHNLNSPQPNQQLDSDEFFSFLNPEVDGSSLGVSSPYDNMVLLNPLSTPDDLVLHQHQRPSAHGRSNSEMNMPWSGSVSPSLVLTPSEPNSSASFLMPNHSFTEDYALAHVANLSRRHSAGATSGFPRGRSEGRSAPSSRGSSRGSSPYSRAGPALGPTGMSISPTQIFGDEINQQHLTVPGQHFEGGHSQGHQRRHSFTLGVRPESLVGEIFEMDPFYGNGSGEAQSPLTPTSTPTTPLTPSRTVAQVASPAGITASERRRTKAAKFACNQCPQTFTTNHNLKNHINAHNGVKKHACEFCTRAFTTASVLARHGKTCKAAPHHP